MTQTEFNSLPALMPRKVFLQVTGLDSKELYPMINLGHLKVFRRPWSVLRAKRKRRRTFLYYKSEAARLGGFKL